MKKSQLFSISSVLIFLVSSIPLHTQVPENGLVFDGNDDYVVVLADESDELNPEYSLTMECWVKLNEAPSNSHRPHLVTKFQSYALAVDTNGFASVFLYTGIWWEFQSTTLITPNKWYHLAGTFDGVTARIFINGIEENSIVVNEALNQNIENVRIGALNLFPNNSNTNGIIEEARIWNVTRTQAEIQSSMNRTIPGSTAGLVGYWRFDESSGTNADCETTYDNDGTLTNMSVPAAWITSTASMGDASIFAESADITETTACAVDVDFRSSPEGPGSGRSLAAMQVNELPSSVTGLYPDRAQQYWEIWSEDPDFDGNFTADVRFHYDNISNIGHEPSLKLFRRDDANGTWSAVTGATVVTNDGGSSTTRDGNGYVELTIRETTAGDFSGQYILSWSSINAPPVVSNIPNQSVAEGAAFSNITLDNYVDDPDNADSEITWTVTGENNVTVTINNRVATITAEDPGWNGTETITFRAEDPDGETDTDLVTFTVTPTNDPPVVDNIPNQDISEGGSYTQINLDDYVADVDNADNTLVWTVTGESYVTIDITDRVATITVNDPEWNGQDVVTFTVEDPDGLQDSDDVRLTVVAVNDFPVVTDIPDQTIVEGQSFSQINLDVFVTDADHADDSLSWTALGQSDITVSIVDRIVTLTVDPDWNGSDTLVFTAKDPRGASDKDTSIFTVTPVNDAPKLSKAIPDTSAEVGKAFLFVLDPSTFVDIDPGDSLVYSASESMEGTTPGWITFDPASRTFSGTPADGDKGMVEVIVTATDHSLASVADTFSIGVESYVGIGNPLAGMEIKLYPNPNNGRFVIESDMFELKDVMLEIFNEKGQLIWNREIKDEIGTLHESVDLNSAPDGLYLLRMRNKSGMINKRFVISN